MNFAAWSSAASKVVGRRADRAGRLRQQKAATTISQETIYRFIYAQIRRTQDYAWRHYLPRLPSSNVSCRGPQGWQPAQFIKDQVPIGKRPIYINARRQAGHWETDYPLFRRHGQSVLVAQERVSRFVLLAKTAQPESRANRRPTPRLALTLAARAAPQPDPGQRHRVRQPLRIARCLGHQHLLLQLIAHGKRAASRTPTDGFAASFRAKPTCANVPFDRYNSSPAAIMPRRGSAWDTKPPPSCSPFTCCTSNVNPPGPKLALIHRLGSPQRCPAFQDTSQAKIRRRKTIAIKAITMPTIQITSSDPSPPSGETPNHFSMKSIFVVPVYNLNSHCPAEVAARVVGVKFCGSAGDVRERTFGGHAVDVGNVAGHQRVQFREFSVHPAHGLARHGIGRHRGRHVGHGDRVDHVDQGIVQPSRKAQRITWCFAIDIDQHGFDRRQDLRSADFALFCVDRCSDRRAASASARSWRLTRRMRLTAPFSAESLSFSCSSSANWHA